MLSAYSLSLAFHRTGLPLNTLASAYIFMLFISPLYLFELSFQLSFLAVASILLFFTPLYTLLPIRSRFIRWAWGLLCVSLAAQIGTLPVIVYTFGRISCYSLLTNYIAIPAATLILYLGAALILFSPLTLWAPIAPVVAPTHQPYIRRPDQHHPVFEYSHKTDQHAAWSKHRKRKNQSASGNRSLCYHPAHLCPMAQDR